MEDEEEPGLASVILGSILALPLFFVIYILVATIAYAAIVFLNSFEGRFIAYAGQLFASVMSAYIGVVCGRMALDAALKAWNGWPIFVVQILFALLFVFVLVRRPDLYGGWWEIALYSIQNIASLVAGYVLIVMRADTR
jgi:hypothetical protein